LQEKKQKTNSLHLFLKEKKQKNFSPERVNFFAKLSLEKKAKKKT
jgi:hypothetical protein